LIFLNEPASNPMKTDTQIQQDVLAELLWEPEVHASHIGVEVAEGVVTLVGPVASFNEKWSAERAAQRVGGVRAVAVELKVELPAMHRRSDADIAHAVENVLAWASYVPAQPIKVLVEGGWVTLSGEVQWQYQRLNAGDSVRMLAGVTGLSNQIAIRPTLTADAVRADVEAALRRRASADARTIAIEVRGGEVTLTGTVHSWFERDLAAQTAWGSPGVHNVVDKLSLVN
jgi:osmotically-inducible protein OsmY